ncbi:MAG: DUF1670 domain-containing protein [Prolixibacteraceae bacterium]|nr:DUF1670 domain-containing protein [Prolixibacteraceae bacterium]
MNFFKREFSSLMGPMVQDKVAEQIIEIFENMYPNVERVQPGQILWNALDKTTRASSPNRRYVPVILTVINQQDVQQLENGESISKIRQNAIARIIEEAYQQGGLLSMRDISLILLRNDAYISKQRKDYETKNKKVLPHTGNLHDMGTCTSHKNQIVYKVIVEKKDAFTVARETNHSQRAVDRYLVDYYRVKTVFKEKPDPEFISMVTNMSKSLVIEYINLYKNYEQKT